MSKPVPVIIDPMSLDKIKLAVVAKAVHGKFLDPLRSFFHDMELEWGEFPTACAFHRNGRAVILLGRQFFAEQVQGESEAADVVLHEIMHHVFQHLFMMEELMKRGYTPNVQNVAMDAIINSYLHKSGCAGFMERFYKDEREFAFLRPNSSRFAVPAKVWRWERMKPMRKVDAKKAELFEDFYSRLYKLQVTLDDALVFFKEHFPEPSQKQSLLGNHGRRGNPNQKPQGGGGSGQQPPQPQPNQQPPQNQKPQGSGQGDGQPQPPPPNQQNGQGSGGQPPPPDQKPKEQSGGGPPDPNRPNPNQPKDDKSGGGGDEKKDEQKDGKKDESKEGDGKEGDKKPDEKKPTSAGDTPPDDRPILSPLDAARVLGALGVRDPHKKAVNNFAAVIRKITANTTKAGEVRADYRLSRRLPAKLARRDLLTSERGRDLFTRPDFQKREVWLFPDVSGSVAPYLPFVIGLIRSLQRIDVEVKAACWADNIAEVSFEEICAGKLPANLGSGTCGEQVAQFMQNREIKEGVILTDNAAGSLYTKIDGLVHLCLIEGSSLSGSFIDPNMVPRCKVHKLKLVDGNQ